MQSIMKKEYKNPEMEIVMLNALTLLAGSETMEVTNETTTTLDASEFHDNGGSEDW